MEKMNKAIIDHAESKSSEYYDVSHIDKFNAPNHRAGAIKHCLGQE